MPHPRLLALGALLALPGCALSIHGEAGYTNTPAFEGSDGLAVNVYAGTGDLPVDASFGVRSKVAEDFRQIALSVDVFTLSRIQFLGPYFRGGLHLLQLEEIGGDTRFGLGSPYVEAGLLIALDTEQLTGQDRPSAGTFITLGGQAEYDIRLDDQTPNTFSWGLLAGFGVVFELL